MAGRPSSQGGGGGAGGRRYTILIIENPVDQPTNNWPRCYPILYHDIENDFTNEYYKKLLRASYFLFKSHSLADIAIVSSKFNPAQILAQLIASALYLIIMPVGDFLARHLSLYAGFKMNSEIYFRYYFLGEFIVILFGVIIGVGFLNEGSSGTIAAVKLFELGYYIAGAFTAIFLVLVAIQTILHFILIYQVYKYFRSQNFRICPCC
ncbi:scamp family-domain-containing protein [Gigaspora rosea]|uniref:Scamp family-domain-containing protein n=1 Tax=Gigaspora rosea TaxID=44941 RepID=A0A397UDY5_9GLOM|nr:scamp family-domain-containing protein [Gigaspora rosea]